MAYIALSDGHGMETPGKRTPWKVEKYGRVIKENEFNRAVVKYLKTELERQGHKVLLVAPTDYDTPLITRTNLANQKKVDLYISVHYNAGGGEGVEIWIIKKGGQAERLAKTVLTELVKGTPQKNRGVKEGNLHEVRETKMPAILIEAGFMDNKREAELMLNKDFQMECATEIAKGVQKFYGKPYKAGTSKPKPTKPSNPFDQFKPEELKPAPNGAKFTRTLKYVPGNQMEGKDVLAVQQKVGVKPAKDKNGKPYGTFGPLTKKGVEAYQKKHGIKVTGEVGDYNWSHMFGKVSTTKPDSKPKPKTVWHRVSVDGKQVASFKEVNNAAEVVKKHLSDTDKEIEVVVERVKL